MYLPTPSEGGNFTPPPSGTFPAICYRLIDLGTQETVYQGEKKHQRKISISWEIADPETKMEDGRPFTISQRYTFSMHEKATLRRHLESWRGAAFVESDFGPGGFNLRNILGKPCFLPIVHKTTGENTYANIAGVMKLPKGFPIGKATNEILYLSLEPDDFDSAALAKLSERLQETIRSSPEYKQLMARRPGSSQSSDGYDAGGADDWGSTPIDSVSEAFGLDDPFAADLPPLGG